ncbi:MAG: acyltransferase family protein [Bacteroidia bacterium]|nr:acyltransferase family protein [Bacteroidia bacterium]
MRFFLSKISSFFYASKVDSKRRGWIDYARGIVIIYVVYRHTLSGLIHMGYPIRNAIFLVQEASMPIFFVVSGIFIHSSLVKRGFLRFVRFKFDGLLYPYLVWVTIHLTLQIVFSNVVNSDKNACILRVYLCVAAFTRSVLVPVYLVHAYDYVRSRQYLCIQVQGASERPAGCRALCPLIFDPN